MSGWRTPPAAVEESRITETLRTQAAVVGLGHAGTAALRALAEAGVSAIGIEQMQQGRFSVYGCDIGHINSAFLAARGVPRVDPIDLYNEMMRRSGNKANPGLMMRFAQGCGDAFDWYVDRFDADALADVQVTYFPCGRYFDGEISGYRFWPGTAEFPGIWTKGSPTLTELTRANQERARQCGAQTAFGAEALYLESKAGRVTGLIARFDDEQYVRILAERGVILAAGDFGGNPEMRQELCSDVRELFEPGDHFSGSGRSGRGIQMGLWAGGRLEAGPIAAMGGNDGLAPSLTDRSAVLILDETGRRFCNESLGDPVFVGQAFGQRHHGVSYQVFDSDVLEDLERLPPSHGSFDINSRERVDRLLDAMGKAVEAGPGGYEVKTRPTAVIYAGSTVGELLDNAGFTGALRQTAEREILRYQAVCRLGRDDDFGKDPKMLRPMDRAPFFLQKVERNVIGNMLVTVGGLVTDERQRVLDENYRPIGGLFATGNCCGLRFGPQYSTPMPGISIAMAITLGREAGREAGKE